MVVFGIAPCKSPSLAEFIDVARCWWSSMMRDNFDVRSRAVVMRQILFLWEIGLSGQNREMGAAVVLVGSWQ